MKKSATIMSTTTTRAGKRIATIALANAKTSSSSDRIGLAKPAVVNVLAPRTLAFVACAPSATPPPMIVRLITADARRYFPNSSLGRRSGRIASPQHAIALLAAIGDRRGPDVVATNRLRFSQRGILADELDLDCELVYRRHRRDRRWSDSVCGGGGLARP